MPTSPLLGIPFAQNQQAQIEVTHNEAVLILSLALLGAIQFDQNSPPGSPQDGDVYVLGSAPTGDWTDQAYKIAVFYSNSWFFLPGVDDDGTDIDMGSDQEGMRIWDREANVLKVWDGSAWGAAAREVLSANRTYYVNGSTGSDSNDGLSSGSPFLTIQKAVDTAVKIDAAGFDVTISIASGTYNEAVSVSAPTPGLAHLRIEGDTATPSNVVINAGTALAVQTGAKVELAGVKLTASSIGLLVQDGGFVSLADTVDFGACTNTHIFAQGTSSVLNVDSDYEITGDAVSHFRVSQGASVKCNSKTITLTGTRAFTYFAWVFNMGILVAQNDTFDGDAASATGDEYLVDTNSLIQTNGGGAGYFPGDVAGSATNGGVYN